jgi:serine/threonine-protein kinase
MNFEPGLRISDTLVLRARIGEGGMGQVWSAYHAPLDRIVAVKFLSPSLARDEVAVQRFALEAQTCARMRCPNIPQVFDIGTTEAGLPYIVMELVEGTSLRSRIAHAGALTPEQTVTLMGHVGEALDAAHSLGVVHRDVKPENIVLVAEPDGGFTAKLLDFGIAKLGVRADSGGLTRTGVTLGTPSYMSPEQLLSPTAVGPSADLWSFAVVAYTCLTGELPFAGETAGAVCLSIHNGVFAMPSALRPEIPVAVDRWFQTALNREPTRRFPSALAMAESFHAAVTTPPPPAPERETRPGGRPDFASISAVYLLTKRKRRVTAPLARAARALPLAIATIALAAWLSWGSGRAAAGGHLAAGRDAECGALQPTATAHEFVVNRSRP